MRAGGHYKLDKSTPLWPSKVDVSLLGSLIMVTVEAAGTGSFVNMLQDLTSQTSQFTP